LAEFATNNHQSETTGVTPFFANNGCHPHLNFHITAQWNLLENHEVQEHATKLQEIHSLIQAEMSFTQVKKTRIDIAIRHLPIRWQIWSGSMRETL
jgi:hypothetical protein